MNTIALVSYEDCLEDTIEIQSAISPLCDHVVLMSKNEFLTKSDPPNYDTSFVHIFGGASINSNCLGDQVIKKIEPDQNNNNIALLKNDFTEPPDFLRSFNDYIFWPCKTRELYYRLQSVLQTNSTITEPQHNLCEQFEPFQLLGHNPNFVTMLQKVKQVAEFDATVMLQGETGTGKENAARAIHHLSRRSEKGFVPINCATMPDELFESELFGHEKGAFTDAKRTQEGLVELARGGTLFFDEVDSLSQKTQAALLRFLQTQEYRKLGSNKFCKADVRIVAASNANFTDAIAQQRFRADLYFRLNVLNINIPPLRERLDDIPYIAKSLIRKFAEKYQCPIKQLTPHALTWLKSQPWTGNVRELENILLREMLMSRSPVLDFNKTEDCVNQIPKTDFSDLEHFGFQEAKEIAVKAFEKSYLESLLCKTDGNISEASRLCGKERRAIGKMLKKHNIDRQRFCL